MTQPDTSISEETKPHNPYAFPLPMSVGPSGDLYDATQTDPGMTLRDYFAIKAPVTMADAERTLKDEDAGFVSYGTLYKRLAQMQYFYADQMLKTRTL